MLTRRIDGAPSWLVANGYAERVASGGLFGRYRDDRTRGAVEARPHDAWSARLPLIRALEDGEHGIRARSVGAAAPAPHSC